MIGDDAHLKLPLNNTPLDSVNRSNVQFGPHIWRYFIKPRQRIMYMAIGVCGGFIEDRNSECGR